MSKTYRPLRAKWLGRRLHALRMKAGMKLATVADQVDRDPGSVSRWENGAAPIRSELLLSLLDLYGVTKRKDRADILALCDEVASHGWWDAYTDYFEPEFADLLWIESHCTAMQQVEMMMIPGLLQAEPYAEALIRNDPGLTDALQVRRLTELRMARQQVLERDRPPKIEVLLYEAALRQHVGGKKTIKLQLQYLLELSSHDHLSIRLLPMESWAHAGTEASSGFSVFRMPKPHPDVVYAESSAGRMYLEDDQLPRIQRLYDRLSKHSLDQDATSRKLKALTKEIA